MRVRETYFSEELQLIIQLTKNLYMRTRIMREIANNDIGLYIEKDGHCYFLLRYLSKISKMLLQPFSIVSFDNLFIS